MTTFWVIVSVLCGVVALGFVLWGNMETAFVVATLGCVAWFLHYRAKVKQGLENNEEDS